MTPRRLAGFALAVLLAAAVALTANGLQGGVADRPMTEVGIALARGLAEALVLLLGPTLVILRHVRRARTYNGSR